MRQRDVEPVQLCEQLVQHQDQGDNRCQEQTAGSSAENYAGDLRHGEEHRVVAQGYPGQGEPDEGGPDSSGREDQAYQRGALQRSSDEITSERGDRNQRICEDSEGEAKGIRAQLSSPDEDKGHTGARHRSQG